MSKLLFVFFFFLLFPPSVLGQQDSVQVRYDSAPFPVVKKISDEDLEQYHNDPKFDYEIVKAEITWWDNFKAWLGNILLRFFEWVFGTERAVGFLAAFLRIVPYILLGILIYILIRFFLKVNANALTQTKANEALVSLSEEEHIIKNEDIQQLIRKALAVQDYRLAIRYYYLFILQKMSDKEVIEWEQQKTNDDYLKEIQQVEIKRPFRTITRLYDYIWYGGFVIDASKYQRAELAFLNLQKILEKNA